MTHQRKVRVGLLGARLEALKHVSILQLDSRVLLAAVVEAVISEVFYGSGLEIRI